MSQQEINNYFRNHWYPNQPKDRFDQYKFSGNAILQKIKPTSDYVLDVGCGKNPFKGKITNLIGIDPASPDADHKIALEDFNFPAKFDVALCLGSINFGDDLNIQRQIMKLTSFLKPEAKIFWRCNPGVHDHTSEEFKNIQVFKWTKQDHYRLAMKFGFIVVDIQDDSHNRIYAEWARFPNKVL